MRHGQADLLSAAVREDRERALTGHGRREVVQRARDMAPFWVNVQIFCSPYLRARQTAEEVAAILGHRPFQVEDFLQPEMDPEIILGAFAELEVGLRVPTDKQHPADLLIISHMPLVSRLCAWWVQADTQVHYPLSTAGVHELEINAAQLLLPGQAHWVRTYT